MNSDSVSGRSIAENLTELLVTRVVVLNMTHAEYKLFH